MKETEQEKTARRSFEFGKRYEYVAIELVEPDTLY